MTRIAARPQTPSSSAPLRTVRRALAYSLRYRLGLGGCLAAVIARGGCSLVGPLLVRRMLDRSIPSARMDEVLFVALCILAIALLDGGFAVVQRWQMSAVGESLVRDLRTALFAAFRGRSLAALTDTQVGESLSRINNDVSAAQNVLMLVIGLGVTGALALATFVTMLALEWRLALLSLVTLPLSVVGIRLFGTRQRLISRRFLEVNAEMTAMAGDTLNIGAALVSRLLNREASDVLRFRQQAETVRRIAVQRAVIGAAVFAFGGIVTGLGVGVVYGVGGMLAIRGSLTIGTIVAFAAYLMSLYGLLRDLGAAPIDLASALVSFERVFEVIDECPEPQAGGSTPSDLTGMLEFRHVSYSYPVESDPARGPNEPLRGVETRNARVDHPALSGVSFCIQPGQVVAVVGRSGAGKTTLAYLATRVVEPCSGEVLLDGHVLGGLSREAVARHIGMVPQDPYLYHDTVRSNLLCAKPDASSDELVAAAKAAGIHDRIMALPLGYDSIVGERGFRLSGGEKQRLAIARVFLQDPRLFVLDEATSQLDAESAAAIRAAIARLAHGRTCLVIAHNLYTAVAADCILVLEQGRVVERGTHAELLAAGGRYCELCTHQVNGFASPTVDATRGEGAAGVG